jgi:hypothetical protein
MRRPGHGVRQARQTRQGEVERRAGVKEKGIEEREGGILFGCTSVPGARACLVFPHALDAWASKIREHSEWRDPSRGRQWYLEV